MKIYDISQPVFEGMAVWPGDEPVAVRWPMRREDGDPVDSAAVTMSVHAGTHVDGPAHVVDGRPTAAELPLDRFIGPALVIDARGRPLDAAALGDADADLEGIERVLFRTRDRVDPTSFPHGFEPVRPELARALIDAGVRLVGTDAPSVDAEDSESLETHRILIDAGVVILESVVLDDVPPGRYTLVALPLRLGDADSAPVRAALVADAGRGAGSRS